MRTHFVRNIFFLFCTFGLVIQFSCKKEDDDLIPPRIFRPIFEVDNTTDNVLIVYFKSIEEAKYYEGDISQDSAFHEIEQSIRISPDTADIYYGETKYTLIRFNDLLAAQDYFIRVKAIHADTTMNSEYHVIKATTLSIFVSPTINEILDNAFKCKWDRRGALVSKIRVTLPDGSIAVQVGVSPNDNDNGVKLIKGLTGGTTYSVFLYSGDILRGKGTVTTQPAIEGDIVDLRDFASSTILHDTISNVASGSTILLKRGKVYTFPTTKEIKSSITVRSGYDFITDLAVLNLEGNPFQVPNNSTIDEIVFRDVSMRSTFEGSGYAMFLDSCNINKVEFDNVHSHGHRGFFRVSEQAVVNTLSINNCVIDSLREYGICHQIGEGAYIGDIIIKNSTFWHVVRPFFCTSTAVTSDNTLTIENCTFYHCCDGGRYFFDYTVPTTAIVKNCIFGAQKPIFSVDLANGYRAYKVNTNGTIQYEIDITFVNNYKTSDFITNESDPDNSKPLDLIPYDGDSYDLFTDPDNRNFKIRDGGFSGKSTAGDPRWW
jgi:hypothetical protein